MADSSHAHLSVATVGWPVEMRSVRNMNFGKILGNWGAKVRRTLQKLTLLIVVFLAVIGGIWGGFFATAAAQTADEDAIKAEVAAAGHQLGVALNTSDSELFDSLWLQSDKPTYFSPSQPFRVDGWPDVRQPFAELLSLPQGNVNVVVRQQRIDLLGDDVALRTGHFILKIRPPGGSTQTVNGRFSRVLQKVDGKWLNVHGHTSTLP